MMNKNARTIRAALKTPETQENKAKNMEAKYAWPIHPNPSMQASTIIKHRQSQEKENRAKQIEPEYPQMKAHSSSVQVS